MVATVLRSLAEATTFANPRGLANLAYLVTGAPPEGFVCDSGDALGDLLLSSGYSVLKHPDHFDVARHSDMRVSLERLAE
jgi:hypothetical protein